MHTVEVVKTWRGWHVTRKYCGRTMESKFFSTIPEPKKSADAAYKRAEKNKDAYVAEWMGA